MKLTDSGWVFEVDRSKTREYAIAELTENCDCDFCRNFYRTVDTQYPHLRSYLDQFGAELFAPDSMIPYISNGFVEYEAQFRVFGELRYIGPQPMRIDHLEISVIPADHQCFFICLCASLPWDLDIPLAEALCAQEQDVLDNWINTPIS